MNWNNRYRHDLTPREIEVLRLLCEGLRCKQVAARLGCSARTVSSHCYSLFRKTACQGPALGIWAVKHGHVSIASTKGQSSPRLGSDVSAKPASPASAGGSGRALRAAPEADE